MDNNESIFVLNHEVKTALNGIIGYTQLMLKTPLNVQQKQYIEKINACSLMLLHSINNILDYHRLLNGKVVEKKEHIEIVYFINEIIRLVQNGLKNIKFNYTIDTVLPATIYVDKNKLLQILLNVILSFINAETNNSYINLQIYVEKDDIIFKIKSDIADNNLYIQEILNQEFSDVKNNVYKNNISLDLYICKMISEYLNWELDIDFKENERLYKISIPLFCIDCKYDVKILVADDNKNNVILFNEILSDYINQEYITIVYDGIQVIKKLKKEKFDIIFLDMNMPGKNGMDVIKYIKKNDIKIDVYPVSASDYGDFFTKDNNYDIKQYIGKPYNIEQIKNIILKYINK